MTAATVPGLDEAPTTHEPLLAWVRRIAELTTPARVVWCDGSEREWWELTYKLVEAGTFSRVYGKPDSFRCVTDPADATDTEDRVFVCTPAAADAGPTNNWTDPLDMRILMIEHYRGCMTGRTMYVVPFRMGALTDPVLGVEITDSEHVVAAMRATTRIGTQALVLFDEDTDFVHCLHSVGAPLKPGRRDVPWPSDRTRYVAHFPGDQTIWSYGSGFGGNALLNRESAALRLASVRARDEGWFAEHMAILKVTSPENSVHHLAAAFPDGCGKTTLAMLEPSLPGWRIELLGDDIAWLRFGADGRLRAVNPETGLFGTAPGTGWETNPNLMRTLHRGNSIFTNVARTDDGDVWWEGYSQAPPDHLITWQGADWTLTGDWGAGIPTSHPDAHYCTPLGQCPVVAPEWDDPAGVPLSAIIFGGRRAGTVPLVVESRDWQHGVFLGATISTDEAGAPHRDPMAMRPFLGYHVGDYLRHWLDTGRRADAAKLPKIFHVNWFRRGDDGRFRWPGFGENARVLRWIVERVEGRGDVVDTPIGGIPTDLDADALAVDRDEWRAEVPLIEQWFATIGDRLPAALHDELDTLRHRLQ